MSSYCRRVESSRVGSGRVGSGRVESSRVESVTVVLNLSRWLESRTVLFQRGKLSSVARVRYTGWIYDLIQNNIWYNAKTVRFLLVNIKTVPLKEIAALAIFCPLLNALPTNVDQLTFCWFCNFFSSCAACKVCVLDITRIKLFLRHQFFFTHYLRKSAVLIHVY